MFNKLKQKTVKIKIGTILGQDRYAEIKTNETKDESNIASLNDILNKIEVECSLDLDKSFVSWNDQLSYQDRGAHIFLKCSTGKEYPLSGHCEISGFEKLGSERYSVKFQDLGYCFPPRIIIRDKEYGKTFKFNTGIDSSPAKVRETIAVDYLKNNPPVIEKIIMDYCDRKLRA